MTHELKTVPPYWEHVDNGTKPFDVRLADRGYSVGDMLVLCEWQDGYTGRRCERTITYVLAGWAGLQPGYVVLGLGPAA